ncbi:hypothetical protein D3C72_2014250 [compost metagenome]
MAQTVVAIDHGAAGATLVHTKLRCLVEPPASEHAAIMFCQAHAMTVDAEPGGMQHGPHCSRPRLGARPRFGQPRLDALGQQRFIKSGCFTFHGTSLSWSSSGPAGMPP